MTFARILPLLLACCAAPQPRPVPDPAPEKPASIADPAVADAEAQAVLAERLHRLAVAHFQASELADAQQMIRRALALDPDNEDSRRLAQWIDVELGDRSATVSLVAQEAVDREAARREEELVAARRLIARAEASSAIEDWRDARRSYERAVFLLRSSRYREDSAFVALRERAETGGRAPGEKPLAR